MTPAELLAWAARAEEGANIAESYFGNTPGWARYVRDYRLAARLARFAAERGGLPQEEKDGKA
ncbi:MAG: hypothetical protein ABFD89_22155 [Bryobacteraceae bacterium]